MDLLFNGGFSFQFFHKLVINNCVLKNTFVVFDFVVPGFILYKSVPDMVTTDFPS